MRYLRNFLGLAGSSSSRLYSSKNLYQKYKHSCTDLRCLQKEELQGLLQNIECVLSDADGVLWLNEKAISGSAETINCLQSMGKKCFIITNNSTRTRQSLYEKACNLGFELKETQIISTCYSTAKYLEKINFKKRAYIIGKQGLILELKNLDIKYTFKEQDPVNSSLKDFRENLVLEKDVQAVIVGFDEQFSYTKLTKACTYLLQPECLFIATNMDEWGPTPTIMLPGTACFVNAIQCCFPERQPLLIGKPNPEFVKPLIKRGIIQPDKTLMIGDRGSTDMLLAYNCGFHTLFVLTGTTTLEELKQWQKSHHKEVQKQIPDFYLNSLGELRELF